MIFCGMDGCASLCDVCVELVMMSGSWESHPMRGGGGSGVEGVIVSDYARRRKWWNVAGEFYRRSSPYSSRHIDESNVSIQVLGI